MLDWLISKTQPQQQRKNPYIINFNSTLYIQCAPNDPHTASNIVITAFVSKIQRNIVPIRVQWSRSRDLQSLTANNSNYPSQKIVSHKSNTYMCQPSDLGCYLNAKIYSLDQTIPGWAQVTVGPIKIDVMIKRLMQGAMFGETLLQQVVFLDNQSQRNGTIRLYNKTMQFKDDQSQLSIEMPYNLSQPKIQVNPKDNLKVYLRFEQDEDNKVQKYLAKIFDRPLPSNLSKSNVQSSRVRLFKSVYCANKFQFKFLSRNTRDLFLFMHKAFICKQMLKTTIVFQKLQKLQAIETQESYNKFLQFVALREQINRLITLCQELQKDRDKKITDLSQLEQSISQLTLTYMKIIEEKSKLDNIDLNKSYSEIGMKRQQMINRKNFRQMKQQNQNLKQKVRDLTQQIQLIKFFKKEQQNDSMLINQTTNPFLKKPNRQQQYTPIKLKQEQFHPSNQTKNMIQLSKSYAKILKQNQRLRQKTLIHNQRQNDKSRDMLDLLNSLQDQPQSKKQQKLLINQLKKQNAELKKTITSYQSQNLLSKSSRRINSLAHQNKSFIEGISKSMISNQQNQSQEFKTIPMNQSMTSQAQIKLLEQKFIQISALNQKILQQNARLRKQRDHYRESVRQYKLRQKQWEQQEKSRNNHNDLDNSVIIKVKEQNQNLINQRNALRKKIDSLTRQKNSQTPFGFKNLNTSGMSNDKSQKDVQKLQANIISLNKQIKLLKEQNDRLKQQNIRLKKEGTSLIISQEATKLKRINIQLLEQIKNLKIQLQKKMDKQLYNSRVIQLQSQINHLRNLGGGQITSDQKINQMKTQMLKFKKENQKLKAEILDKDSKMNSQAHLIERLMSQQNTQGNKHSNNTDRGKDIKSKSQYCNSDKSQSVQKYKKKIKQLQQQIVLLRKSSDALNRSRDLSMDMQGYYQEQIVLLRREMNTLIEQNQKISKMCDKYAKQARQANKFKKQMLQKLNSNNNSNINNNNQLQDPNLLSSLNISQIQKTKQKSDYW